MYFLFIYGLCTWVVLLCDFFFLSEKKHWHSVVVNSVVQDEIVVYSIFSSKHSGTKSFSQNSRHFWIWLGDFCESRDGEQFRFDELFFELKKPQNPHTLSSLASEYRRGTEERMAAAAVFKGWEGGVCTHPHFIPNSNPKKFDFLLSKQYQIWSQNPENFKILRFDKFFGCFFWPKKDKNGQNVMDIVMQVWVCKSVRVCYIH